MKTEDRAIQDGGDMELVLYNGPHSTCSQKVRLTLWEKQVPFVDRRMNLSQNEHLTDWYLKLNPNGVVPTLVHGSTIVTDSSVINEYLEELFPAMPLMPETPSGRAHMRAWRQYIDEVPTPAIRVPSFNAYILKMWSAIPDSEFSKLVEKRSVRKHLYKKIGREGFSEDEVREALERLRQTLERMEGSLKHGPWLCGAQFTLADISIIPTVVRLETLGYSDMWSDLPAVSAWYSAVKTRPSFSAAYHAESRPPLPADANLSGTVGDDAQHSFC